MCLFLCLFVCLCVCLSLFADVLVFICFHVCFCFCLFVVYVFVSLFVCLLFMCLFLCLFLYLFLYLFVCLFVCLLFDKRAHFTANSSLPRWCLFFFLFLLRNKNIYDILISYPEAPLIWGMRLNIFFCQNCRHLHRFSGSFFSFLINAL